jgi:hypothetical protein
MKINSYRLKVTNTDSQIRDTKMVSYKNAEAEKISRIDAWLNVVLKVLIVAYILTLYLALS